MRTQGKAFGKRSLVRSGMALAFDLSGRELVFPHALGHLSPAFMAMRSKLEAIANQRARVTIWHSTDNMEQPIQLGNYLGYLRG